MPAGMVRVVQVVPSGDVMHLFVPTMANNDPDHVTLLMSACVFGCHVMTLVPLYPTATNKPEGDQTIECHQEVVSIGARGVQVVPSGEVMTRLVPVAVLATAANKPNSGDHAMFLHEFASAAARAVHVMPSGEVMTRLVPSELTAANSSKAGDHAIDCHAFASEAARAVHVKSVTL